MALADYSELQTEIANYLHRDDLASQIPTFIKLAETRLNRRFRLLQQEQESTASYDPASNTRFIALPDGFIELLELKSRKQSDTDLDYRPIKHIPSDRILNKYTDTTGQPAWYTLRNQIEFERLPDVIYTVRMHYLKKWDIATDDTNWLLTNHSSAYLYGSLLEAEPYLENDERVGLWKTLHDEVVEELDDLDQRSRDDEELDTTELSQLDTNRYGYDINTDRY